jgi:DNA-binding XRE family transcriptional regulator
MTQVNQVNGAQMPEERKTSEITRAFRLKLGAEMGRIVTQEEFGQILVHGLVNTGISRQTIHKWESGKGEPDVNFLLSIYTYHFWNQADWRRCWALDCLKVMKPETFDSGIIDLVGCGEARK